MMMIIIITILIYSSAVKLRYKMLSDVTLLADRTDCE